MKTVLLIAVSMLAGALPFAYMGMKAEYEAQNIQARYEVARDSWRISQKKLHECEFSRPDSQASR